MSITISKKYLKGEDDNLFYPVYIIAPPAKVPELEGYVLKILQDYVSVKDQHIVLDRGNEWNKKEQKIFYTFEKESKEKGRAFKRFRYTEEEVLLLYRKGENSSFEKTLRKRESMVSKGAGYLVRVLYTYYDMKYGYSEMEGWFIEPKEDTQWVYPFDYDPLRDLGKHKKTSKGFKRLEFYEVEDISILQTNANKLEKLLDTLDHFRKLKFENRSYGSLADYLIKAVLHYLPYELLDTFSSKTLRGELLDIGAVIEEKCKRAFLDYRQAHIDSVVKKIKDLIGIDIKGN